MGTPKRWRPKRKRVGRVSYFYHHGSWWLYYREGKRQVRRRIVGDEKAAEQMAAQVNAQVATEAPTMYSFTPDSIPGLCQRFLDYHEQVLRSSLATISRYRSALKHLEDFAAHIGGKTLAHEIEPDLFVRFLRSIRVAPNGHAHATRRHLKDRGVRFILETCRSLYGYAAKKRHLPPYAENPFAGLGGKRFRIDDAKPIFVFDADTEMAFFAAANTWAFPIHFTLAKTGLRSGELIHLLIEDVDLEGGWLHACEKPELGWRIKTRRGRAVPLVDELIAVLRRVIGDRTAGPVFLREHYPATGSMPLKASRQALGKVLVQRIDREEQRIGQSLSREERARIAREVWREAGAVKADQIRLSFIRTARRAGLEATCPKSWRHSFATLLQDANVDPLIRQITLGHVPAGVASGALGMTSLYTHTRPETQRREILRALHLWPQSLEMARRFVSRSP